MTTPADELTRRVHAAYQRQELTAPTAAVLAYVNELLTLIPEGNADLAQAACKLHDRSLQLQTEVERLVSVTSTDDLRTLRHDLRASAAYLVMAGEEWLEDHETSEETTWQRPIRSMILAARRVIEAISALRVEPTTANIDPTFGRLPEVMAGPLNRSAQHREPGRILLVDDNEFSRDVMARMLRADGHTVETATGGQEAQQRLLDPSRPAPDLILSDVMMPGMSGPELLRWLKSDSRYWHLPVIMISAWGEDEGVLACIAAGAEDYLTRPVRAEFLRARLAGSLEKKRLRDREGAYQARIAELVRAIFPPAVVTEWETTGTIRPRRHDHVGILFLDIVGFTSVCERLRDDPGHIVDLLQKQVERFEATVARHGVQKVKTIGDGFLGVAGLNGDDPTPALTLLRCALDMVGDTADHPAGWRVRVGIHVGPVVTGVLGRTQFSFDLWGHAVNMAARIESHGQPGRVSLSDDAWAEVAALADGEPRQIVARGLGLVGVVDFVRWR